MPFQSEIVALKATTVLPNIALGWKVYMLDDSLNPKTQCVSVYWGQTIQIQ